MLLQRNSQCRNKSNGEDLITNSPIAAVTCDPGKMMTDVYEAGNFEASRVVWPPSCPKQARKHLLPPPYLRSVHHLVRGWWRLA